MGRFSAKLLLASALSAMILATPSAYAGPITRLGECIFTASNNRTGDTVLIRIPNTTKPRCENGRVAYDQEQRLHNAGLTAMIVFGIWDRYENNQE